MKEITMGAKLVYALEVVLNWLADIIITEIFRRRNNG
jgi:hypothetical protein